MVKVGISVANALITQDSIKASLDFESLGDAHAGSAGRYKSVLQAFALGYSDGVNSFIRS